MRTHEACEKRPGDEANQDHHAKEALQVHKTHFHDLGKPHSLLLGPVLWQVSFAHQKGGGAGKGQQKYLVEL